MIAVGFIAAVVRKQTIGQAVGCAVFDHTIAALAVVRTGCFGADTFFNLITGHDFTSLFSEFPQLLRF